jgi:hypothetical protein
MQQIVLRAMDQMPRHRYASAHEMAQDLAHMQDVTVDENDASHRSYRTTAAWNKNFLFYVLLAAIPVVLFCIDDVGHTS